VIGSRHFFASDRPEPGGVGWVRAFLARLRA
jgi:hypothetical protein